ncbi:Cys-tRNA(Pro) deacylase [Tissierella sp. MSJ-40]|uniref:Cys-tRNA(Pro)/Cys-tRNA(Cys) deacylase n=1 Tax=Tissierella simiarum TaxID=2841534 RepID=A0ABS6E4T3_9FIRM|nr:Cys-tRNA(Pro) deacylase [Tissierella simiarum]MBU5437926.1 Cys-tRNA(Pro) deacylase [Tissierella simiarum]
MSKTNAMRILDKKGITYNIITYENKDGKIDGVSVANKIGRDPKTVFKTLVGHGKDNIYVFIIPVQDELDYKKAALATEEKKIELINVKDIIKYTGYIRGGCSPIGMKKAYPTFIHESSLNLEKIIVSGGKIGMQIELNVEDLKVATEADFKDLIK